jgi:hypothetical protein
MVRKRPQDWGKGPYPHTLREAIHSLSDDDMAEIYDLSHSLAHDDTPSRSDVLRLFYEYLDGTEQFRRGVDAASTWTTGYRFDSLVAKWITRLEEENQEDAMDRLLVKWRKS